jgi:hypothetical protein
MDYQNFAKMFQQPVGLPTIEVDAPEGAPKIDVSKFDNAQAALDSLPAYNETGYTAVVDGRKAADGIALRALQNVKAEIENSVIGLFLTTLYLSKALDAPVADQKDVLRRNGFTEQELDIFLLKTLEAKDDAVFTPQFV